MSKAEELLAAAAKAAEQGQSAFVAFAGSSATIASGAAQMSYLQAIKLFDLGSMPKSADEVCDVLMGLRSCLQVR